MPWLRGLGTGLAQRRARFDPMTVRGGFVVHKAAIGQALLFTSAVMLLLSEGQAGQSLLSKCVFTACLSVSVDLISDL